MEVWNLKFISFKENYYGKFKVFIDFMNEIKSRLNSGNACYYSVKNLLSSRLVSKNLKIKIYKTNFAGCAVWVRNWSQL
jgi:hypothetical protein